MKTQKGLLIIMLIGTLLLPTLVSAAPSSPPPGGVTNAEFNSVQIGPGNLDVDGNMRVQGSVDFYGNGGLFNSYSTNGVLIMDPNGLDVRSTIGNYSSGSLPVTIKDSDGLDISKFDGTVGLKLKSDGTISSPSGLVGFNLTNTGIQLLGTFMNSITTYGWLNAAGASITGNLNARGVISNPGYSNLGRVYVSDDFQVTGDTIISGDLNVTGSINAAGGIGSYSTVSGNKSILNTSTASLYVYCPSGSYATGCGYYYPYDSAHKFSVYSIYAGSNYCRYYGRNDVGSSRTLYGYARCFNPST